MIFRNSKIFRNFLLLSFLFFNSFGVSTSTREDTSQEIYKNKTTEEPVIEKYPSSLTENVSKKLDSLFQRIHKRHDFHGSVLVAKNGKLVFENEYGTADFNKKTKLNENSVFQLASVSKQFTAAAILILYERGLLGIEDNVNKYFPDFPYEDITIRQLLNHTSGLPKYFWLAEHKWDKEKAPVNSEMIDMVSEHNLPLFFKSGSRFDYSNTGYFVLASIVEKVSGMEFGEFLSANIFKPLHMKNSFVYRSEKDSKDENQLKGYRLYRGWRHLEISETVNDAVVGDKNVYSTTEDLFRWINALNSGKVISENTLNQMFAKGETKYGRKVPYGFGFRINDKGDEKVIYHNGKWNGFSTSIWQYPKSDLVVITLEHTSYNSINYLNKKVREIVNNNFEAPAI